MPFVTIEGNGMGSRYFPHGGDSAEVYVMYSRRPL
jgi:hypothetical protein